jgi:hypothetical protein
MAKRTIVRDGKTYSYDSDQTGAAAAEGAAAGASIGGSIGAAAGSFIPIPVVGTAIGALVGTGIGAVAGALGGRAKGLKEQRDAQDVERKADWQKMAEKADMAVATRAANRRASSTPQDATLASSMRSGGQGSTYDAWSSNTFGG